VVCFDVATGLRCICMESIQVGADIFEGREVLNGGKQSVSVGFRRCWMLWRTAYLYHGCTTFENPVTWLDRTAWHIGGRPVRS